MSEAVHGDGDVSRLAKAAKVVDGGRLRLAEIATLDPAAAAIGKAKGKVLLATLAARLGTLQERLHADGRHALLFVLQGMDAGGKDGTIAHVLAGVNPQGLSVTSFKRPTADEAAHDVLWRVHRRVPARGTIGVFNRSHYEDVVVPRVHPHLLAPQRLAKGPEADPQFWAARLGAIRGFEADLARQNIHVAKVLLHIGLEEQRERLLARLDDPAKLWKFDPDDIRERAFWPAYMDAYGEAIAATATPEAPWYVVAADQKWFARLQVAAILVNTLEALDLRDPVPTPEQRAAMADARRQLGG